MSVGVSLTESTFDEFVGAAEQPVLIDFWAEWCGPCKIFDPVLADLAASDPRFVLASVDIDRNPALTIRFGVMSAPTLLLVHCGEILWRAVGARGRARLSNELEPALSGARR